MKGKGVVDNLFIIRGIINHAKYLGKELWLTFYDIEKCFDKMSTHRTGYNFGSVQIKPMEFVDDIAVPAERKLVLLQVIVFWRLFSMKR